MLATWAFACRYRFESVMKRLEENIQGDPSGTLMSLEEATRYVTGLPSASMDLGCTSLMHMLYNISRPCRCPEVHRVARVLREYRHSIRDFIQRFESYDQDYELLDPLTSKRFGSTSTPSNQLRWLE
jgi:hypothetical protein